MVLRPCSGLLIDNGPEASPTPGRPVCRGSSPGLPDSPLCKSSHSHLELWSTTLGSRASPWRNLLVCLPPGPGEARLVCDFNSKLHNRAGLAVRPVRCSHLGSCRDLSPDSMASRRICEPISSESGDTGRRSGAHAWKLKGIEPWGSLCPSGSRGSLAWGSTT